MAIHSEPVMPPPGGGGGGGATNLSVTRNATTVTVASDTGTDAVLPIATVSLAGVQSAADKLKLDGIATGADATSVTNVATALNAAVAKTTPVDADTFPLNDSAATFALKKVTFLQAWTNYFKVKADLVYAALVHAARHKAGGADPIKLDELAAPTDVTTLNVSTTAHGLAPKLPNDPAQFLNGVGGYSVPAGGGGGATNLTSSRDGTTVTVLSDTGTDAVLPAATPSLAGVSSAADKTKLDGIAAGADVTTAASISSATLTGAVKATPADADQWGFLDSAASNVLVRATFLQTWLNYFRAKVLGVKLDELAAPTDITTLNASITAHGLSPKLPNNPLVFYNGVGGFTVPAGSGGGAGAGNWELLNTVVVSTPVVGVDLTGLTGYRKYMIEITGLAMGTNDDLYLRTSTNNGSSFDSGASDYGFAVLSLTGGAATATSSAATAGKFTYYVPPTQAPGLHINIELTGMQDSVNQTCWFGSLNGQNYIDTAIQPLLVSGRRYNTAVVNALRLYSLGSVSLFNAGTFRIFGWNE